LVASLIRKEMPMQSRSFRLSLIATSFALGAVAWWALSALAGEREAWDSALYFVLVLPALTAGCALAGWNRMRGAAWIAPAFALGEWSAMVALAGGDLGIWPLGLAFTAVTHAPAVGLALVLARRPAPQASRG